MPEASNTPALKVQLLRGELSVLPSYASDGAAGLDLHAALDRELTLAPGERAAVPTGIAVAIPSGYEGQVRARSGLARKHGIALVNAPGTIDADYRGEVQVLLINLGQEPHTLQPRDRIAQLVIAPVIRVRLETVDDARDLGATPRGEGGFGSTGR
jgi:dUTP pyrophosphatase